MNSLPSDVGVVEDRSTMELNQAPLLVGLVGKASKMVSYEKMRALNKSSSTKMCFQNSRKL